MSRKKSDQVWKRFRAACDEFFAKRDEAGGGHDAGQIENLNKKKALIDEVKAFAVEGAEDARSALLEFQARWNQIGFVPFRSKALVQDEFRKLMNEKFAELRDGGSVFIGKAGRAVRTERDRLVQKFLKKEQEIATWENNIGFFAKSKDAEALLKDLRSKIDQAKEELSELEARIKDFDKQFDEKGE